ncbi:enoyl-CoA hydratase-related protein [Azoarcus olearius]|uniref:Probable enoyl-CoA hydratase n=1 Tax=Azoarcus sp. (strain BH72) TaxID=418699 RepID=A1K6T9_AZOSB|nr:enoyl-CoA hydratase-related protein [Azoarcus olearius]ANQ85119.1 enoyl-CoA hydratase [Azoarcus olearius]CAL94544.1 probable enoyl-CoA hydratase [Azoarcus olearius]
MTDKAYLPGEGVIVAGPDAGVLEIRLDRPQAKNALSTPLLRSIVALLEQAEHDDAVRCIVLTGGDQVFAAGADLAEMAAKDMQAVLLEERPRLFGAIARFPKPIIAAVCGYALGGGCELVMHADIVIAGESAQFGQPEINLGIIPGAGGTQRLTRAVGKSVAMKLVLAGEFIPAQEARAAGLVAEVVADEACIARAHELAGKIAKKAPLAVRLAKDSVLQAFETPLAAGLAIERRNFVVLAGTEDRNEGVKSFLEKRKPVWKGR